MSEENDYEEENENEGESGRKPISVTVKMSKEMKELQKELGDLKEAKELLTDLREKASEESGRDFSESSFNEVRSYFQEKQLKQLQAKNDKKGTPTGGGASGRTPFRNSDEWVEVKEYDSYKEMLEDVKSRMQSENPEIRNEAEIIMDRLREKLFLDEMGNPRVFDVEFKKGMKINEFWDKISREKKKKGDD